MKLTKRQKECAEKKMAEARTKESELWAEIGELDNRRKVLLDKVNRLRKIVCNAVNMRNGIIPYDINLLK